MRPSEVSSTLRRIATKIDNSENPKREFVAQDLRRVIMAMDQKQAFLIITDEPQGICIGFQPLSKLLNKVDASIAGQPLNLISDDGSISDMDNVYEDTSGKVYSDSNDDLFIRSTPLTQEEETQGCYLLGPDLYIWRSIKEFTEWVRDYTEG